jgi:hypothetical protein
VLSDFIAFKLYIDLTYAICANILAIVISTKRGQGLDKLDCTFPKGIWLRFDFDDSHPVSILHILLCFLKVNVYRLLILFILCFLYFFLDMSGFASFIFTRWINYTFGSSSSACW